MGKSKFDKTCVVCGKKYQYCDSCSDFRNFPRWMNAYCSENCRTIFNTMMAYKAKLKTSQEVTEILKKCDLSKKDTFDTGIQTFINEVFGVKLEEPTHEAEPVVEPGATVENTHDKAVEDIEETVDQPQEKIEEKKFHKKYYNGYKKK